MNIIGACNAYIIILFGTHQKQKILLITTKASKNEVKEKERKIETN